MTGSDLRTLRLNLGLSQKALGERLSVSENTIWRWERGLMPIEHPGMLRLALRALMTVRQLREFEHREFEKLLDQTTVPSGADPVRLVLASDAVLLAQRVAAFLGQATDE